MKGEGEGARASATGAADALQRLLPRLHEMGISRIGDITGLDRIGIPVAQAVRPLGLANAVTQGKGTDLPAAAISAIMEAAEQFFAERVDRMDTVTASARALDVEEEGLAKHVLPDAPGDWAGIETAWVGAGDLVTGGEGWLPMELVHTVYAEPGLPTDGLFLGSTTGLACGFCEPRVVLHAILECVERDAIARAHGTHGFFHRFRIDVTTTGDDTLDDLVERVRSAGLHCEFWAAPAAGDVPVIWCQLMEDGSQAGMMPYPADGFAADPDPAAAMRRALLEAAQSRLAAISGARDDITRQAFPAHVDWDAVLAHRRFLAAGPRPIDWRVFQAAHASEGADAVDALPARLARDEIGPVLRFRYDTDPFPDIVALRVVVPALLPLSES